jgi:hypothetical protein
MHVYYDGLEYPVLLLPALLVKVRIPATNEGTIIEELIIFESFFFEVPMVLYLLSSSLLSMEAIQAAT